MAKSGVVKKEEDKGPHRPKGRKNKQIRGKEAKRKRPSRSTADATLHQADRKKVEEPPEAGLVVSPKTTVRTIVCEEVIRESERRAASTKEEVGKESSQPHELSSASAHSSLGGDSTEATTTTTTTAASQTPVAAAEAGAIDPTCSSSAIQGAPAAGTAGLNTLSGAAAILASTMNDPSPHLTSSTPAAQRQLLSAILAEGIASGRALDALQRSPVLGASPSPAQQLGSVNRALQEQLLIGELLKQSPNAQASANTAQTIQLLSQQVQQQQQQQSQPGIQNSAPQVLTTPMTALGTLPSPGVDTMLLAQPKLNLLGSGVALEGAIGAPPLFSKQESSCSKDDSVEKDDTEEKKEKKTLKTGKEQGKKQQNLPPRKRRKMVNFKLDSDFPKHEGDNSRITFPLPVQDKERTQALAKGPPTLVSYKKLWGSLEKKISGEGMRQELFRRRLGRGKVFIVKNKSK